MSHIWDGLLSPAILRTPRRFLVNPAHAVSYRLFTTVC
jgi:hypothetical protein